MAFNPGKCKKMSTLCLTLAGDGHANPKHEYTMGAQKIAHSTEEKDLGVVINQSLSPSHHIATCVSRANRLVGLIKRTYENKSKRNIIALYKSLVRPKVVTIHRCIAILGPAIHVSYRDPSIAIRIANEGFMLPSFRPTGTPQPTSGNQWDLVRILVRKGAQLDL